MSDAKPTIPLKQGENVWLMVASDKFGLSADDIITDKVNGLAVALDAILSEAKSGQPVTPAPWQEISTGGNTFRLGSARPIEVISVGKVEPAMPKGKVLADRNSYSGVGIPSALGQSPWFVLIRIWWRAPDTELPWPSFTERFPLLPDLLTVNGQEWVLFNAVVPEKANVDPGDASWGKVQTERAAKLGSNVLTGVITLGAAAVAILLLIKTVQKPKQ
jgi:hypothetical protein